MRRGNDKRFREGAASFYIVAIATLLLVIVAASFAAVIISEITRTSNDDLAQSAYDSALAGVEDGKLAFYNYQNCLVKGETDIKVPDGGGSLTCGEIIYMMKNVDCDMVGKMLGRIGENDTGEINIQTTQSGNNDMQQAYTCVKLETELGDYRSTVSLSDPMRVMRANFGDADANSIKAIKVSWYSDTDGSIFEFSNFDSSSEKVKFPTLTSKKAATPPTIALSVVQTGLNFKMDDFDITSDGQTNRGTVYLVPTDSKTGASSDKANVHKAGWNGTENYLARSALAKSNDKVSKNLPYAVYCDTKTTSEFVCTATIELPEPIGGARNENTFVVAVSIPYGQPSTDFALEFLCDDGSGCVEQTVYGEDGTTTKTEYKAMLDGVQVQIDSTGRANDLYRRVETRMDAGGASFPYPIYTIQVLGGESGSNDLIKKNFTVTCEYEPSFGGPTC